MSKFFKALEKVENEEREATLAAAPPPAEVDAPSRSTRSADKNPGGPRPVPARREPADVDGDGSTRRRPRGQTDAAVIPTVAPAAEPEKTLTPTPAPVATLAPIYGAPVARETKGPRVHERAFTTDLEPAPFAEEPGELDDHLVSVLEPTSVAAEQYRAARLAIETYRNERGTRVVAVSSPGRGDGKTITAVNLAGALAQASDARVVLVDADLRHPGVGRVLGLPPTRGLSGYLADARTDVETIVQRPPGLSFAVVAAGPTSSMPYELLKSSRLTALLAALGERFDYVVIDTPPVLPYPDVGILRDAVDGFVMVVRANRTTRELLRDSLNALGRPRTLGLIYNDDDRSAISLTGDDLEESRWWRQLSIGGGARSA